MTRKAISSPMPWPREKRDGRQTIEKGSRGSIPWHLWHCNLVHLLSRAQLFATPWTVAWLFSLPFTVSCSLLNLISIESMMPSNHLILCHPLLLPSILPSIRVFPNELAPPIRWPKYWNFIFSISPSIGYPGVISFRITNHNLRNLILLGLSAQCCVPGSWNGWHLRSQQE